jgi:hypothetical protein
LKNNSYSQQLKVLFFVIMFQFNKSEFIEVASEVITDNQMETNDSYIEQKLEVLEKSEHFKSYSYYNSNRESSMTAMSVAMAHSVSRHSFQLQIDGSLLEMIRFVGRVTDTLSILSNKTNYYLNDLKITVQSVNSILLVLLSISVDVNNKSIQNRHKVKVVVGTLEVIESQIALTVLFGDFDAKYHVMDVEMESLKRQSNLKLLNISVTSMSHHFSQSREMGELMCCIYCILLY